jgi:TolB-like protein
MGLFTELKRRNVFRAGVAYIVGAWLLAQIADLVLDVIGAPDIVLRTIAVVLALGLLPALVFAWVFEMTPEGIKRETEVDRSQSTTAHTGKKVPAPAEASADEKSIAVLPFANRSNQDDDLFFTDGIHDDLLTQLAKIHELNVISRTSVMEYRDTRKNLREIGAELNVGTILEGGIQKVGDRVRINAQLIDVATDQHLWAETFDRELTAENIFDIQSEIARRIVQAVAVELTPAEQLALAEVPTQNLAAYEAYLRAREVFYGANYSRSQELAAQPWLEKAIALDPNYTEALALLANLYGQLYWRGLDTSDTFLQKYRETLDRALESNPNSPSALRASANYYYRVENDYRRSLMLVEQAIEQAPGNVDLHADRALSLRRLGRWDESIASLKRALEIDPANRFYAGILVETMIDAADYAGVLEYTEPLEDADPGDLDIQVDRARAQLNLTGDLEPLERVFEKMNLTDSTDFLFNSARVHWLQRDIDATIEVLNGPVWIESRNAQVFQNSRDYELAHAYRLKGDNEAAERHFERIIAKREKVMNSALQVQVYGGTSVALSLAWMGRHEEALELAARLVDENPYEKDALLWGWLFTHQAMIKGLAGDQEGAIDDLAVALQTPSALRVTVWDLHYDPNWDFMRDNPRFVELATPPTVIRTATP